MAEFTTMTLECKCTRMTRLYRSVYDTEPSTTLLPQNAVFYSRKQYRNATVELLYISEGMNQSSVPVGYWCPAGSVQVHPIFDEKKQHCEDQGKHGEHQKRVGENLLRFFMVSLPHLHGKLDRSSKADEGSE